MEAGVRYRRRSGRAHRRHAPFSWSRHLRRHETDVADMYGALLTNFAPLGLAYVHLEATTNDEELVELRRVWPGTLVMNPSSPMGRIATNRAVAG